MYICVYISVDMHIKLCCLFLQSWVSKFVCTVTHRTQFRKQKPHAAGVAVGVCTNTLTHLRLLNVTVQVTVHFNAAAKQEILAANQIRQFSENQTKPKRTFKNNQELPKTIFHPPME